MHEFWQVRLNNTVKYNPHLWSDAELYAIFVARTRELEILLNALRRTKFIDLAQHILITGYRGMGKSTLLRRLDLAIRSDADLKKKWLPLLFPAGHYKVNSLADFWLGAIDLLQTVIEKQYSVRNIDLDEAVEKLHLLDGEELENYAVKILKNWSDTQQYQIVLLVDGTDQLLENMAGGKMKNSGAKVKNIASDSSLWRLRKALSECTNLFWIGSSYLALESDYSYADAFHDFFDLMELEPLGVVEMRKALVDLAATLGNFQGQENEQRLDDKMEQCLRSQPERLELLHSISNGNLRSMIILYDLFLTNHANDFRADLKVLVDAMTPVYQARIEQLSIQTQKVLAHLMESWAPISSGELSEKSRLPRTTISANLSRLEREGLIRKISRPGSKPDSKHGAYQVSDRLFNIWYLLAIHTPQSLRAEIRWLMEFMRLWYSEPMIRQLASEGKGSFMKRVATTKSFHPKPTLMPVPEDSSDDSLENARLHLVIANTNIGLRKYSESIAAYEEALRIDKNSLVAFNNLAYVYIKHLHSYDKAEEIYNRAIKINPSIVMLWNDLGRLLQDNLQRYEDAEIAYLKALDIDAGSAITWINLGDLLQNHLQRHEEAEVNYLKAIDIEPESAIAWSNLGDLRQNHLQHYEEAETAYRKAIEVYPRSAITWNNLGSLLENHFQRYKEAEVAYRKAIEFDPSAAISWHNLSYLLSEHYKRYKDAEEAYRKALELDPSIADSSSNFDEHECSEAYQQAEKEQIEETDSDIRHFLSLANKAHASILGKQPIEARKCYRELIDLVDKKDLTDEFACLLLQAHLYLGNSDSALLALEFLAKRVAISGEALTLYKLSKQVIECQLLGKGFKLVELLQQSQYEHFLKPIRLALLAVNGDRAEMQRAPEEVQKMAEAVEEELEKQIAAREQDIGHTA